VTLVDKFVTHVISESSLDGISPDDFEMDGEDEEHGDE